MNNILTLQTNKKELAKQVFDTLDITEGTRKDYQYRIGMFLDFLEGKEINSNTFLEYKRYLDSRSDFTIATKNKYLATAKVFLKEANRRGFLPADITQNIKGFKQNKKHKREGLSENEIKLLVSKLSQTPNSPINARLKAIFCLLTLQGLRQIEIVRLDIEDINLNQSTAFVQGKGSDDKEIVYLHPETVKAIKEHIRVNGVGSGTLFKSLGNRSSERITTRTVRRQVNKLLKDLEIEKTPHGFRHYYVTKLLKQFDVRDVRKFSRHKSLEMLIVYDDEIDIKHKSEEVFSCFGNVNFSY